MSLRRRVLIGILAVAAVLVGTNVVLFSTLHSFLLDRVDRQLIAAEQPLAERPFFRGGGGPGGRPPADQSEDEAFTEYFIAVGDPSDGTLTRLSSALADQDQSPPRLRLADLESHLTHHDEPARPYTAPAESGDGSWRLVAVSHGPSGRVTVVGTSLNELETTFGRIRLLQLAGTGAVLVALGAVSWWMLRLGVHPLAAMAEAADDIAGGDLSRRVDHPDERTEVGRFGAALNAMLDEIEEAFRSREASEDRLRRFAADASHELRTPLTSIKGYAELWRAGGLRGAGELAEAMRRMEEEAGRMGSLVDDLLLLARLDQRRPLERGPVRLDELAADGVRDARAVEPDRPIELSVRPVVVEGDERRLRQVVDNLLANARIHTPAGTPVSVSVSASTAEARLEVADQGPGLAPEVAAKVFERFYRADPARARVAGGSGLGLSIVAAIAEAHGGRARVDSAPGRGSRFVLELPLPAQEAPATESGGPGSGVAAGPVDPAPVEALDEPPVAAPPGPSSP